MRNIKTSLRFVRNSALLFVAASGVTYLSACSDKEFAGGDENNLDGTLSVNVTTGSNPSLAKSYYNTHLGTRAAAFDVPEHPGMPAAPTAEQLAAMNPLDANSNLYYYTGYNGTPDFYVKGDVKFNQLATNITVVDANWQAAPLPDGVVIRYFIDGNVSFDGFGGDENRPIEVHILNGGKLSAGTNIPTATTIYLYGGGDILKASNQGDKIIHHKGTLIAEENLDHGDTDITIQGNVYTYGKIHGKNVTLVGGEVYAGCAVTAEENIYLTGDNSNVCAGYVSAPVVELAGNSPLNILLRDGGYLNATKELRLKDVGNVFVMAEEGEYAMVETKELNVNNKRLQGTFYNVAVKYDVQTGTQEKGADEDEVILEWNESVQVNGEIADYTVVDGDKCAPKVVQGPKDPTPDPTPELENIGSVAPSDGDHTHPISATCIYTNGQDAYLSWHTQGPNFHGCIEYLTVANGTVTLNSWLETSPSNDIYGAVDFNHVIFDNGKIFVAGDHPKKGGILGWIECNDGKFVTGEAVLNIRQLYNEQGGSGNCIIRNGNYYQVASVKGFETFNVSDFAAGAKPKAVAQLAAYDFDRAGMTDKDNKISGKHIATDGQNVVMLTLINRNNDANTATASIKVYAASDVNYENEIASYVVEDAVLSPVDGKDVIAIQGSDIYVCLGQGGVQKLTLAGNTITKAAEFVILNQDKATDGLTPKERAACCANGLAVDGKYVYVAHGGAGLVVLNKSDLSYVTRTRYNGGNSANYVNLNPDGYIYVAYGKSNVQVFAWKK
ncbi:MAG: hypothetical protein K2G85_09550 [Muribaculaceae bacterium]|nr:hypothetical protein [Muribaculaceae bacterium]